MESFGNDLVAHAIRFSGDSVAHLESKADLESCQVGAHSTNLYMSTSQNTREVQATQSKFIHTPANNAEFKDVLSDVSIKHLDKCQVHVECF